MKKETKKSILFYAASALLYMASLISFISGNDNSMAVVWLCLGSSFLCLGSTHLCLGLSRKKKGNNKTNTDDKQFPACIVGKSGFIESFCDLQLLVDRFTA